MSSTSPIRFVDRVNFFNGQRLFAEDLMALEEYQREMRWLHNRSLHQPGVASGYAVSGEQGDSSLVIQPGYAIDAAGRELILAEPRTEPVPPVAGDGAGNPVSFDLTVSYSISLPEAETRRAVCENGGGAVRLREEPVFCWVQVGAADAQPLRKEIERGDRILLARVQILNCALHQRVSIVQRRNAKPTLHPYVFAAFADVTWKIEPVGAASPLGIRLTPSAPIDTRAAGFKTTTPAYFVSLLDAQSIQLEADGQTSTVPLDGFLEISNAQTESFECSVLIPTMLFQGTNYGIDEVFDVLDALNTQGKLSWRIEWMGVEG